MPGQFVDDPAGGDVPDVEVAVGGAARHPVPIGGPTAPEEVLLEVVLVALEGEKGRDVDGQRQQKKRMNLLGDRFGQWIGRTL